MTDFGLIFSFPQNENELSALRKAMSRNPFGCEAYTHLVLNGEKDSELFMCGKNADGKTVRVIFSYGGITYSFDSAGCADVFDGELSPFGGNCCERLFSVRFDSDVPEEKNVRLLDGTEIKKAFELICDGKMTVGDEQRYVFRVRASAKGLAETFGAFDKRGDLLSTASIVAENEKYSLIGDVFTRQNMRGNGLAGRVCLEACRRAVLRGKVPWLLCGERLLPFYFRLGFRTFFDSEIKESE